MEVSYRRDLNHNYMILENERITGTEYPVRMIEQNNIPELLPLQLRKMNGKTFLYYEITSRQPLSQVYETVSMRSRDIEQLLIGIRNGMERARQYLLSCEDLLLDPEFIYINMGTGQIQLCCIPFLEKQNGNPFLMLSEFILKRLDHGDRHAVDLGYDLFAQVSQENFSFQECLKELLKEKKPASEEKRDIQRKSFSAENEEAADDFGISSGMEETADNYPDNNSKNSKSANNQLSNNKSENDRSKKKKLKNAVLCAVVILSVMLIFGAVVYLGKLDLTQTGGLAFLLLALLWIIYSVLQGRKQKEKKHWLEDDEDAEEDEWMETLLSDIYDKEAGRSEYEDTAWGRERKRIYEEETDDQEGMCGETRCLTEAEYDPPLRLCSTLRSQYQDIELTKEKIIIGKKRDQVDVCLKQDCISRIHARLERQGEDCFLTDLNSMNGTFVNGDRLRPNEKRQVYAGDRISFASLRYVIK